jgi:hypothetical protein
MVPPSKQKEIMEEELRGRRRKDIMTELRANAEKASNSQARPRDLSEVRVKNSFYATVHDFIQEKAKGGLNTLDIIVFSAFALSTGAVIYQYVK